MNKTKMCLTAFAVLASILMLMTPTIARPMAENTSAPRVIGYWPGFVFDRFTDAVYIPGIGWVSPDDPTYDDWLELQNQLQNSGLSTSGILGLLADIIDIAILLGSVALEYFLSGLIALIIAAGIAGLLALLDILSYDGDNLFWFTRLLACIGEHGSEWINTFGDAFTDYFWDILGNMPGQGGDSP
jgi:hypothetical protein